MTKISRRNVKTSRFQKDRSLLARLIKPLLFLGILSCIAGFFVYLWVDNKVLQGLGARNNSTLSAVYAAPLRITSLEHPSLDTVKHYLQDRNYREVASTPNLPGEFLVNGNSAEIYVREFDWLQKEKVAARLISINFDNGEIIDLKSKSGKSSVFTLEPKILATLGSGDLRASNYKRLSEIPAHVKNAVIAIEDERFYKHIGVDPIALFRATATNIMSMQFVQGGSTLTQQLAKNTIFTPEKTLGRKFLEMFAAISLERHLTKDEILERYLNEIYLGQEGSFALHGVAEASSAFFGKALESISIAEAAMLAGIIKAPSYYSPRKHLGRAQEKKATVLDKMYELGFINDKQLKQARLEKIVIIQENRNKRGAPYFTEALQQELGAQFNIDAAAHAGVSVFTGLSFEMQNCAEDAVTWGLETAEKKYPKLKRTSDPLQAALVAIEPHSGLVRAWVGGRDFSENQFNRVSQAIRQIGSTIKPFLYITALDGHLNTYRVATVTSVLSDEPMKIDQVNQRSWVPENYDKKFHGDVTLRFALENSLNLPAVYLAQKVGINSFVKTLQLFRIGESIQAVPALALGATDTTLLRMTAAYGALANGGSYVAPRLFVSAVDAEGEVLGQSKIEEDQVADENAVYVLTDIMKGVLQRGTGRVVRSMGYDRPAAGKTGTSNETRDAWFMGFTPNLVAGVWVGFDDNSKLGLTGGALAAPIWTKFMQCVKGYHENIDFLPPSNVISVPIDRVSLDKANGNCPSEQIVTELYVRGTEPTTLCKIHNEYPEDEVPDANIMGDEPVRRRRESLWDQIFG